MKYILIVVGLAFLGPVVAHGAEADRTPRAIVATFYPIHIALLNIAGGVEGVRVSSLAESQTGCLHHYQLTTRDRAVLSKAEVLVVNGAGLESFLDSRTLCRPGLKVIDASAGLEMLVSEGATNAHVWVSPSLHIRQVRTMAGELAKWDPVHAAEYTRNAEAYILRLEQLKGVMDATLRSVRRRDVITFHEAFPYFAHEFNLVIAGIIEREPGSSPSAAEMATLIQLIRTSGVKTLFVEPQYPAKVASSIARETGATLYTLDPVVSGPASTNAYLMIMERNLAELKRALN